MFASATVGHDFVSTWESAADLNASTVEKSAAVFITIGVLAGFIVLSVMAGRFADGVAHAARLKKHALAESTSSFGSRDPGNRALLTRQQKLGAMSRKSMISSELSLIESALPKMLQSSSFMTKFAHEMKRYHRWLGIVFHHSESFSRTLRITSLATNIISMLFVQSLTYKMTNPDDGSCEALHTEQACLQPQSSFQTGGPKCYWLQGHRHGSCHFKQPSNDFQVVIFVAVFAAMVSAPITLTTEWLLMKILAAKTKKYISKRRVDPASGPADTRDRASGGSSSTVAADGTGRRRRSVMDMFRANLAAVMPDPAADEVESLQTKVKAYRDQLSPKDKAEFDGKLTTINVRYNILIQISFSLP